MMNFGKVLFFNESEGKGIIITSQKEKIDFFVKEWNDFDVMPSLGLQVVFILQDGEALDVVSKETHELQKNELQEPAQDNESKEEEEIVEQESSSDEDESSSEEDNPNNTKEEIVEPEESEEERVEQEESPNNTEEEEIVEPKESEEKRVEQKESHNNKEIQAEEASEDEEIVEEEDEPPQRPDSITISINITTAISNYFDTIKSNIDSRNIYKKVSGSLDYILIKRFLFTTFNNLSDIDLHIITPRIRMLYEDLKVLSALYDDFVEKIKYPNLAYSEVFLSCQTEYMKIKSGAESTIEKLQRLRADEEQLDGTLKVKKEDLSNNIKSEEFDALSHELKSLSGAYVDIVHLMAELDERYKYDLKLLKTFEEEYKSEFAEIFKTQALFYKKDLITILNAQAYLLDSQLWQQAKKSKAVKAHFKESSIDGELNTKTYLKYYLDSLDSDKAKEDTKKLYGLYDYLLSVQKDYIIIVVNSAQDAMEYEKSIKTLKLACDVKAFVDEKSAVKWAIKNSVKILVIEDKLQNVNVEKFLQVYKKHVTLTPKIILLGEKPRSNSYPITCLLSRNASPKVITDNIKSIINTKKEQH